jgi:immune inhibitor A
MRCRLFAVLIATCLVLSLALPAMCQSTASGQGFSAVQLRPDVVEKLRSQGKAFDRDRFPNSINQGKKFNPGGGLVGQLQTAATQNVLVIFVQFSDAPPGGPATRLDLSYYDNLLFGDTYDPQEYAAYSDHPIDRTLKNYYKDVSYGKVEVVTLNMPSGMGWAQSGHPYSYYSQADGIHDNGFGPFPNNAQGLVLDAVNAVDSVVNFSNYAIDGEVPNLFVVFAGTGAEWSGAYDLIWSHSWSLPTPITRDGVTIRNYAMMPEVGGDLTGFAGPKDTPFPPTVGVFAHEYGHVLGLPDQYDYGYESQGTGAFSLMAGGSWNYYPNVAIFNGNSPAYLDAWSKYRLGFVTPTVITNSTQALLPPAGDRNATTPVVYKMVVPNSGGKEYFLFENRQQIGFDEGLIRRNVHGLAIYHVDDVVLNRNYWRPNEAENWKEFRSEGARKAWTGETHYGVSIIQADDQWGLEHGISAGFTGDLYPGPLNVMNFGNDSKPNSSSYYFWAGSAPKFGYSGITADNIIETGEGNISVNFSFVPVH